MPPDALDTQARSVTHHSPKMSPEQGDVDSNGPSQSSIKLPFDPLRIIDGVWRKLWLAPVVGLLGAIALGFAASKKLDTYYTASAQIIKVAPQGPVRQSEGGEPYSPKEISIPNMISIMHSGPMIAATAERLEGKVSPGQIKSGLVIEQERHTDVLWVSIKTNRDAETAFSALNAYIDEVLEFSKRLQQTDASNMAQILTQEIKESTQAIAQINAELLDFAARTQIIDTDKQTDALLGKLENNSLRALDIRLKFETLDLQIKELEKELSKVNPAAAKLESARDQLAALRVRYTDEHPDVIDAIAAVNSLNANLANESTDLSKPPRGGNPVAESLYLELIKLRSEKLVLADQIAMLEKLEKDIDISLKQLPGQSLELNTIRDKKKNFEISREILSARLREAQIFEESAEGHFRLIAMNSQDDVAVELPTQKIAMASFAGFGGGVGLVIFVAAFFVLLDRNIGSPGDLKRVTDLPVWGQLNEKTSKHPVESRNWAFTTWTSIHPTLSCGETNEATVCGIVNPHQSTIPSLLAKSAAQRGNSPILISKNGSDDAYTIDEALEDPQRVLEHLEARPEGFVEIEISNHWQWNRKQRLQFSSALKAWAVSNRSAVIVELDDPDDPNLLLLAEELPCLLWIAKSGDDYATITEKVELYKAAGCRIIGALLDEAPEFKLKVLNQFIKFQKTAITACLLFFTGIIQAEQPAQPLGAGDIVNIKFIGNETLTRNGVVIAPDGCITYLQAQSIQASGLTIDQLRHSLNREMGRYYQKTRIVVTPNFYRSRRVFLLGKIIRKGTVKLDRDMKILDVVTEAGGLEVGLFQQNTVELADLGRSFLSRGGQHIEVDFEALFFRGDMSQNLQVQHGDYFYFPSANSNEIHVFGNVKNQGTQGLLAHTTVLSAIAQAGGFDKRAYKKRILVVRGSLTEPESFIIDIKDTLTGGTPGFRLEPKDIVYVADQPWSRAEELVGIALDAFTQGAVSAWANRNVGPIIKKPILPQIR